MTEKNVTAKEGMLQLLKLGPSLLPFMVRSFFSYYKLKRNAKKAGKIFEKELISQGINRDQAKEMADIYKNSSKIFGSILSHANR